MNSICLKTGIFLKSTGLLKNTVFESTIIFIIEYNEQGAVGFVVNKPFDRSLHELEEFNRSISFPLYKGGPVDDEHLFVLHQRPDLISEGRAVADGVFFGADFNNVVAAINHGSVQPHDIKIFIGYCGWDAGELEAEIEEGSWQIEQQSTNVVFATIIEH